MSMSHEAQPGYVIRFEPYFFRGAQRPHGFRYCLRNSSNGCAFHGIVFGPRENIGLELPEPLNQWAAAGHLPYLPADRPIGHLGSCLKPPRMEYIRERWLRPPGPNATDLQRRIYEARMLAREQRQMKGPDHV